MLNQKLVLIYLLIYTLSGGFAMNKYIIIRSDTKSISSPMSKKEALKTMKSYDRQGISSLIIYENKEINLNFSKVR